MHVAEIIGIYISHGSSDVPYTKEHGSKTNEVTDLDECRSGGGHSTFFQVGVCGPDFRSVGACELILASEKRGLWAENFQIWGLVNWKFPNSGACELKISKFGGLWAEIWVKIEAEEAKISKFSQKSKGGLVNWPFCLK